MKEKYEEKERKRERDIGKEKISYCNSVKPKPN